MCRKIRCDRYCANFFWVARAIKHALRIDILLYLTKSHSSTALEKSIERDGGQTRTTQRTTVKKEVHVPASSDFDGWSIRAQKVAFLSEVMVTDDPSAEAPTWTSKES
jgi:hypothetical protein